MSDKPIIPASEELAQIKEILTTLWELEITICYSHGGFHIDCGGVFDGCNDFMDFTYEDLPDLRKAKEDAPYFASALWCCRKANCQPYASLLKQVADYDSNPVLGKAKALPHFMALRTQKEATEARDRKEPEANQVA